MQVEPTAYEQVHILEELEEDSVLYTIKRVKDNLKLTYVEKNPLRVDAEIVAF